MDSRAGDMSPLPKGKSSPLLSWLETQNPTFQVSSPLPELISGEVTTILPFEDIPDSHPTREEVASQDAEHADAEAELFATIPSEIISQAVLQACICC